MTSLQHGEGPRFESGWLYISEGPVALCGEVAERSKALRQGRNLFGGVGSNPTLVTIIAHVTLGDRRKTVPPPGFEPGSSG